MTNVYYDYFLNKVGRGGGQYYTGIGQIYRSKRGLQTGFGVYVPGSGVGRRRGLGWGAILSSIFRVATPLIKRVAPVLFKTLGTTAVDTVAGAAKDGIAGMNFKDSLIKRGKEGVQELISSAPAAFKGVISRGDITPYNRRRSHIPEKEHGKEGGVREEEEEVQKKPRIIHNVRAVRGRKRLGHKYPALKYF